MLVWESGAFALQAQATAAAADAAAESQPAAPNSASAHEAEVRQLRLQLKEREALVEQLRGDVAALKVHGLPRIVSSKSMYRAVRRHHADSICFCHRWLLALVIV